MGCYLPSIKKNLLLIGDKENDDVKKVYEYIEEHFFGKSKTVEDKTILCDNRLFVTLISFKDFEELENKNNSMDYDLIISFSKKKEDNIKIINFFGNTYYLFYKVCSKDELIKASNNNIDSIKVLLTNHFRQIIYRFFNFDKDPKDLGSSQSSISNISEDADMDDTFKHYFNNSKK